ncbi:MAG: hypothetical protein HY644_01345 [Acidobacteria bacterium]|nr:hypothetical protein [Acidobacteriota bacterium]
MNALKDSFEKLIEDCLNTPVADPQFLPVAEELMELVGSAIADSEDLGRYRQTRERMGKDFKIFMAAPNFPYTVHSA